MTWNRKDSLKIHHSPFVWMINDLLHPNLFFIRLIGIKKSLKSSLVYLIAFLFSFFFQCIYIILKTLADNTYHLYWEENPSWLLLNKYDQSRHRNFFIVKIFSFIAITFYFRFQRFFIVDSFDMKFFLNIRTDFILNSIVFFQWVIIFN